MESCFLIISVNVFQVGDNPPAMLDLRPGVNCAGFSVPDQCVTHTGSSCSQHLPCGGKNSTQMYASNYNTQTLSGRRVFKVPKLT